MRILASFASGSVSSPTTSLSSPSRVRLYILGSVFLLILLHCLAFWAVPMN